jgi:phosphohistidine phosphatase SixA
MIVTVMRHGEAEPRAFGGDSRRALTPRGAAEAGRAAQTLAAGCARYSLNPPEVILHSPTVRTTQTAERVSAVFPVTCEVARPLAPGGATGGVDRCLAALTAVNAESHLLLVSHQPLVGQLAQHWLGVDHPLPALAQAAFFTLRLAVPAAFSGALLFWASPPQFELTRG